MKAIAEMYGYTGGRRGLAFLDTMGGDRPDAIRLRASWISSPL